MDTKLSINVAIMFALSLAFTYATIGLITTPNTNTSYGMGFIFGRALSSTLFPLLVALIPAGIYKLIKKKSMPGFLIVIWALWFLLIAMALFGSMLAAQGIN